MSDKIQCGMRLATRGSEMTCTLERGHEKPVHEMHLNGKFLGGWVDHNEPVYGKKGGDSPGYKQLHPLDLPPPEPQKKAQKQLSMLGPGEGSNG